MRALGLCSGDGRDVLGVLAERSDAARVRAVLVEAHPAIAARARKAAAGFAELAYAVLGEDTLPAVGAVRHDGPPAPLPPGRLYTFRR